MIYIQSNFDRTLPHHFDAACAFYGAEELGAKTRLTSYAELISGKFNSLIKKHLFVGSTEFMFKLFDNAGILYKQLPNSNRDFETISLGDARLRAKSGEKLFIKPFNIKLFTGFVIDESDYTAIKSLPDDMLIMAYKPFEHRLVSEWRVYIHKHKMVDSRHYSDDFTIGPDYDYIEQIIRDNKNTFPCAYTLDVGILENKENVVVEYNDMWAIGNYGIPNDLYVKLLKDRYFEIINQNSIF